MTLQPTSNNHKPEFAGKRIWMYWPGEKAYQFKENAEKGFMACGLPGDNEVGDLNEVMNVRGGLTAALKEAYGMGRIAGGEKLMREFANKMDIGDYVIARCDFDYIVGVGVVSGDYYYDAQRSRFRHCRKVQWIDTKKRPFLDELKANGKWHRVTLMDQHYRRIGERIISQILEGNEVDVQSLPSAVSEASGSGAFRQQEPEPSHSEFMNRARQYQEALVRQWAKQFGNVRIWDERPGHGVWLKDEYALKGLVFYEGFRQEIMNLYHSGTTRMGMNLLRNALRSEHIPYNLFFPMMKECNREATRDFFNDLLGTDAVSEVLDVKIEYAPQPKYFYLCDGTSFDAFILYQHQDGSKGGIGIEVKYTEREYQIGETEYKNTHDGHGNVKLSEHYRRATDASGYYLPNSEESLVSDILRQIWRNHILGASMVQHGDLKHFVSLTLYPMDNPHFRVASEEYRKLLTPKGADTFFTFTYEKLFETIARHFQTEGQQAWIKYLYHRYLFDAKMPGETSKASYEHKTTYERRAPYEHRATYERETAKSLNRGVSSELTEAFKRHPLYTFYRQHADELLIGIRNNYLNIYYQLNNIAEVRLAGDSISCAIHPYFLRHDGNSNEVLTGTDIETLITDRYEAIKHLIVNKKNATLEKMAQQALVMQNNASHVSKWYCVDVEWARSFNNQAEKDSCMASRMDIIAISKEAPHRVAIIELKYGSKSINGNAGVMKHIQDFRTLKEGSIHDGSRIDYYEGMCTDICNILRAYEALGIALPETLRNLNNEAFALKPEFYVLTLDNNAASWGHTTPKQTMAAYLFSPYSHNYRAWRCRQPAKDNVQDKLDIDVMDASSDLPVTFIFSSQTVSDLHVNDILEDESYEIIRPIMR